MEITNELISKIKNAKKVAIFIHIRPDGDCIGAGCSMKLVLAKLGAQADIYCDGIVNNNYHFIKGASDISNPTLDSYDTAIAVDCSDLGRLGKYQDLFNSIPNSVNIDHHKTNTNFAQVNLVNSDSASACEILYAVYKALDVTFDADIAQALYSGVATDTGCFMHSNVTNLTHLIAGDLMNYNFDVGNANYYLFKKKSLGQIQLQQIALNNLRLYFQNKLSVTYLTRNDFAQTRCNNNETFGIVDICVNIDGVEIGALISEDKPGICAVSIRSKGNLDVSKLAEYFGGGGHKNAAGCNIFGNAKTACNKLAKAVSDVYAGIY